jgi:predicted CoA-binding protein
MQTTTTGKKTVVLGASENPSRYSYLAVRKLTDHGHPVVAIGRKKGRVGNIEIETEKLAVDSVDTVTLYLNPANQENYIDYILSLQPKRIIFNPGTENPSLITAARKQGISAVTGCTLVMLSVGNY